MALGAPTAAEFPDELTISVGARDPASRPPCLKGRHGERRQIRIARYRMVSGVWQAAPVLPDADDRIRPQPSSPADRVREATGRTNEIWHRQSDWKARSM
jgi:hypothetical protein